MCISDEIMNMSNELFNIYNNENAIGWHIIIIITE